MSYPVFDIEYQDSYSAAIEFKTQINEKHLGHEQRYPVWTYPKRTFTLKFDKNYENRQQLENGRLFQLEPRYVGGALADFRPCRSRCGARQGADSQQQGAFSGGLRRARRRRPHLRGNAQNLYGLLRRPLYLALPDRLRRAELGAGSDAQSGSGLQDSHGKRHQSHRRTVDSVIFFSETYLPSVADVGQRRKGISVNEIFKPYFGAGNGRSKRSLQ